MAFNNPTKRAQMALVSNLISMSRLDGQLTRNERDYILAVAKEFNLSQAELDQCMKDSDDLVIKAPQSEEEKIEYMKDIVSMIFTEGSIDKQKRRLAEHICEKFGYNGKEAVDFIYDELMKEIEADEPDDRADGILEGLMQDLETCAECLMENNAAGAFSQLLQLLPAGSKIETVRRMFLRIPNGVYPMFMITDEQVDELKRHSDSGIDIAQYALGRYYQLVHPNRENLAKARALFNAAAAQGLGDAIFGLALLARDGYYEEADPDKYTALSDKAIEYGSQKAFYFREKEIIYGWNDQQADPQKVINDMTRALKDATGEAKDDIYKFEPEYFDLLGRAYQETGQIDKAQEAYIKAISMGYFEALSNLATMNCCNDDDNVVEREMFDQYIKFGIEHNDAWSLAMRGHFGKEGYDGLTPDEQVRRTAEIKADLMKACRLGDNNAPAYLGEHYYYGTHGFEEDDEAAWKWFNVGSAYGSAQCYSMMAQMISDGHCPKKVSEKFYAFCILCAYRFGDESKLEDVIKAYNDGLLGDFRNEIEKYYIPRFDDIAPAEDISYDSKGGSSCLDEIADMEISDPWS